MCNSVAFKEDGFCGIVLIILINKGFFVSEIKISKNFKKFLEKASSKKRTKFEELYSSKNYAVKSEQNK